MILFDDQFHVIHRGRYSSTVLSQNIVDMLYKGFKKHNSFTQKSTSYCFYTKNQPIVKIKLTSSNLMIQKECVGGSKPTYCFSYYDIVKLEISDDNKMLIINNDVAINFE